MALKTYTQNCNDTRQHGGTLGRGSQEAPGTLEHSTIDLVVVSQVCLLHRKLPKCALGMGVLHVTKMFVYKTSSIHF